MYWSSVVWSRGNKTSVKVWSVFYREYWFVLTQLTGSEPLLQLHDHAISHVRMQPVSQNTASTESSWVRSSWSRSGRRAGLQLEQEHPSLFQFKLQKKVQHQVTYWLKQLLNKYASCFWVSLRRKNGLELKCFQHLRLTESLSHWGESPPPTSIVLSRNHPLAKLELIPTR